MATSINFPALSDINYPVTSVNGMTGAVTIKIPVESVNGKTGAITLSASDIKALPDTYVPPVTSVNGKTGAITLSASDVGAATADHTHDYVPTSRTINGKALTSNISLTASDVEALPNTYTPPVTSVNGMTGAVTISTGGGFDLLWTNANPTAEFAAQEISISDMTSYKLIAIFHTTFDKSLSDLAFLVPETGYWTNLVEYTAPSLFSRRAVDYLSGKLKFYDARQALADAGESSSVNNSYCIPYKIYGIK